ncbi:MAG: CDP-alcohol phosphatidyltransferase family protein [Alphaproteobacteria bacterium GM7ARS4]|nr:CDP-alcohol phosphatidyltransferase family protein [Alphaproteobacteria bacterium GM7ARS4]
MYIKLREYLYDSAWARFLTNGVTLMNLSCGILSFYFALHGAWEHAVLAVIIASVLDNIDGRLARSLGAGTGFGKDLDSLADVISFGCVPAFLLYEWSLRHAPHAFIGVAALFYVICAALRLARFNQGGSKNSSHLYFSGLSSPGATGFCIFPMILVFYSDGVSYVSPWVCALVLTVSGILMLARFPSFSLKNLRPLVGRSVYVLAVALLLAWMNFWLFMLMVIGLYALSIPVSMICVAWSRPKGESS